MGVGGEKDGSSVPDEVWAEFLRTSAEGGDAPKEPSARVREAAGRLRAGPAEPVPWRAHTGRPRRGKGWYVAGFVAALVLLVVALDPGGLVGWSGGGDTAGKPLAQESERPSEAPPAEPGGRPTLDEPFRGSPAIRWADGAAGITVPPAEATGWMTKAEVGHALARTRDFLAASNLDPAVLRGRHPDRAIALMNPYQKDVRTFVTASLRTPGKDHDPLLLFSRFDPAQARPAGNVVKTRGWMSYREGRLGALEVTADVTYVYPVAPAGGGDEVVRVIVRRETVVSWDDPSKVITEKGTFSLLSYKTDMTNGGCDNATGSFRPEFGGGGGSAAGTGGETADPYDRTGPITDGGGRCGTATRS